MASHHPLQEVFYRLEVDMSREPPDGRCVHVMVMTSCTNFCTVMLWWYPYMQLPKGEEYRSLKQIASKVSPCNMVTFDIYPTLQEGEKTDECVYLESQLDLFARLCRVSSRPPHIITPSHPSHQRRYDDITCMTSKFLINPRGHQKSADTVTSCLPTAFEGFHRVD